MIEFFNTLSFQTPLALFGLLALPVIWWLLRFVPPKPRAQAFPPTRILLEIDPKEETPDKTPWWLLLLRLALAALLILGVSHPFTSNEKLVVGADGPVLLLVDDGWAAAPHWDQISLQTTQVIEQAGRNDRPVIVATTTPQHRANDFEPRAAVQALELAKTITPRALNTDRAAVLSKLVKMKPSKVVWMSDGLGDAAFAATLSKTFVGSTIETYVPTALRMPIIMSPPKSEGTEFLVTLHKPVTLQVTTSKVHARAANGRVLAENEVTFKGDAAEARFNLPVELRNDIQSIIIAGQNHAGARQLLDDRWRRKTIALQSGTSFESQQPLLSPGHYVTRALEPYAEISEPQSFEELQTRIDQGLSMLILTDIGVMAPEMTDAVRKWVENGGLLVRFAGARLAAGIDDLVPVKLREGDRELGSALSWETPQGLQNMPNTSPFAGLEIDPRILITRQVLAEPDDMMAAKTWASLTDGTPLVTSDKRGKGRVVLFHVTANSDWSTLPLSGLFVQMLQRLNDLAPAAGSVASAAGSVDQGLAYTPRLIMQGSGELTTPEGDARPIEAAAFDKTIATSETMPGLYKRGAQERAINLVLLDKDVQVSGAMPSGITQLQYAPPQRLALAPFLFILAFGLFVLDALAALFLGGGLSRLKRQTVAATILIAMMTSDPQTSIAQDVDQLLQSAVETRLAFVKTGEADVDQTSEDGLKGLGWVLADRTSASLGAPVGINIDTDEIVFYPLLYWPVMEDASEPSAAALQRINQYTRSGGTILFDLRDGGATSQTSEALQRILGKINVPPLEPVPTNHVLTRTFYLLKEFPGRFSDGSLWVEAGASANSLDPGTADGVSSIIIGTNDYASAWAMDKNGSPMHAVVPGNPQQREYAYRVGVNIVMYTLTGNYKADQVHIPALLERLGQ